MERRPATKLDLKKKAEEAKKLWAIPPLTPTANEAVRNELHDAFMDVYKNTGIPNPLLREGLFECFNELMNEAGAVPLIGIEWHSEDEDEES